MKRKKGQTPPSASASEFLLYQAEDGQTRVQVRLEGEAVWLSQAGLVALYQTTKQNISLHVRNILAEGELRPERTVKQYLTVQTEGRREVRRLVDHYSLDMVLAVGYRVRSHRGTQFRQWATERLREYVVKGFILDDERLKQAGGGSYFDELLARIRDIRSSEKVFWRKVLEIYATSIDYDHNTELARQFFATVQNKMHWAAHGHTAAEIIAARADAEQPHMGLTSWTGARPLKGDVEVAKNYLRAEELEALNRIVTAYLEFAELQALNQKPMYMRDWSARLDDFLSLSGRDLLHHAGTVSHQTALAKAEAEYQKYRQVEAQEQSRVERDFERAVATVKQLERKTGKPDL